MMLCLIPKAIYRCLMLDRLHSQEGYFPEQYFVKFYKIKTIYCQIWKWCYVFFTSVHLTLLNWHRLFQGCLVCIWEFVFFALQEWVWCQGICFEQCFSCISMSACMCGSPKWCWSETLTSSVKPTHSVLTNKESLGNLGIWINKSSDWRFLMQKWFYLL